MANSKTYLNNDCIVIDDDDDDDDDDGDNIENIHHSNKKMDKSIKRDEDVEIIFDSASTKVLNNNNDSNCRKRTYSASNETITNLKKVAVIDLTEDSDEVDRHLISKRQILKDYPGLCIDMNHGLCSYKRLREDEKKKKLIELEDKVQELKKLNICQLEAYLIKRSLILQGHYCDEHRNPDGSGVKMILLQINSLKNGSIFKWQKPCCTQDNIKTLLHRGFFDGLASPRFVLRMLHHWITLCKPINITDDMKGVSLQLMHKLFYQFRAVCTAVIHEKFETFGGQRKVVEICMMYVGVKDKPKKTKRLKVIIVAAYDVASKKAIMLALPPASQRSTSPSLAVLTKFIDPQSSIVVDQNVNKELLKKIGFQNIFYPFNDGGIPVNNANVLEFTRRSLHIFNISLSHLSIQEIQLCLNELIWRERWGTHSLEAFNSFLVHVSEITRVVENFQSQSTVRSVLEAIVAKPNEHWKYSKLECNTTNQVSEYEELQVFPQSSESLVKLKDFSSESNPEINRLKIVNVTSLALEKSPIKGIEMHPPGSTIESHYYGTYPGDVVTLSGEENYLISCHLCEKQFSKNDLFIEHLIKHCIVKSDFDEIEVCTICLKGFTNKLARTNKMKLLNHSKTFHRVKPIETSCLICDEDFNYRHRLLDHMRETHVELELPYRCDVCNFMCSEEEMFRNHFFKFHNDSKILWCPVCFKIFNLMPATADRRSFTDLNNFIKHLVRHLQKPFVKKCLKCSIHFIHDIAMKEHLKKDHSSCRNKSNVIRYSSDITASESRIVRDRTQDSNRTSVASNNKILIAISKMYFASIMKSCINVPISFKCLECEGALSLHRFSSVLHCKKCEFSTCCDQSMKYHVYETHMKAYSRHSVMKYENNFVSCVCGYQTKYRNKIARHFSSCKFKLLEDFDENVLNNLIANSIILKKSVSIFQVKSTPSVLLSLGLICQR